jgi:hypothetical protein
MKLLKNLQTGEFLPWNGEMKNVSVLDEEVNGLRRTGQVATDLEEEVVLVGGACEYAGHGLVARATFFNCGYHGGRS